MEEFEGLPHNTWYWPRYHIILMTINNEPILKDKIKYIVEQCLRNIRLGDECFIAEPLQISPNHLHLLAVVTTFHSVEEIIDEVKEEISCQIAVQHYQGVYHLIWSQGYCISELGDDEVINLKKWHRASEVKRRRKAVAIP